MDPDQIAHAQIQVYMQTEIMRCIIGVWRQAPLSEQHQLMRLTQGYLKHLVSIRLFACFRFADQGCAQGIATQTISQAAARGIQLTVPSLVRISSRQATAAINQGFPLVLGDLVETPNAQGHLFPPPGQYPLGTNRWWEQYSESFY
jgi:hypothetical protein